MRSQELLFLRKTISRVLHSIEQSSQNPLHGTGLWSLLCRLVSVRFLRKERRWAVSSHLAWCLSWIRLQIKMVRAPRLREHSQETLLLQKQSDVYMRDNYVLQMRWSMAWGSLPLRRVNMFQSLVLVCDRYKDLSKMQSKDTKSGGMHSHDLFKVLIGVVLDLWPCNG